MKFYDSGDWLQVVAAKGIQSNVTAQITWWERNYFGRSTIFRHCFPYCNCSTRKTCSHSSTWMCGLLDYSLHHFHFPTLSDSFLSPLFWQSVIFSPTFCKPISPYSMCFKSQGSSFRLIHVIILVPTSTSSPTASSPPPSASALWGALSYFFIIGLRSAAKFHLSLIAE